MVNLKEQDIVQDCCLIYKEKLAEFVHQQWSEWMKYMFSKCGTNNTIPDGYVERWKRQMNTEYINLSEEEKESDRDIAIKIMEMKDE